MSQRPDQDIPHEKTQKLSDEEQHHGTERLGFVEAQCQGDGVPDDRHPGEEGKPDAVAIHFFFLLFQLFGLDLEPFLDPFPCADASNPLGGDASEPVAQGSHDEAGNRILRGQ